MTDYTPDWLKPQQHLLDQLPAADRRRVIAALHSGWLEGVDYDDDAVKAVIDGIDHGMEPADLARRVLEQRREQR
ncbi:hypothetical protein P0W64_16400 [Tsukamurella sp. 8F]|uniref:hypothetical protein n=1 Tax=unclassified Tsukamurella TaxID=2633480 RepID=UPI0023BA0E79|nr:MULTISPECIES: hypothetical protein [unclassified Tsukamurella]MDF0531116.1 hypothetical protein [Tsukamurella sp. 8J]MDF0588362.1 hypothetical protein [Tsukamurella sp. 8F]